MNTVRLYRGTAFHRRLSAMVSGGAVAPVWATTPATFVLDGPSGQRIKFNWRPGGTSSSEIVHNAVGNTLDLVLDAIWTAATLVTGQWQLGLLFLNPPSDQLPIGIVLVNVADFRNGPAPVVA